MPDDDALLTQLLGEVQSLRAEAARGDETNKDLSEIKELLRALNGHVRDNTQRIVRLEEWRAISDSLARQSGLYGGVGGGGVVGLMVVALLVVARLLGLDITP